MSNIFENNSNKIDLKLSLSECWDLTLAKDVDPTMILNSSAYYDSNLISFVDINNGACVSGDTLYSNSEYKWPDSINSGITFTNIGFTGIDNGLISFNKDEITSDDLFNLITGSTFEIPSGDTRLFLNPVTGNTGNYIYPISIITDADGKYADFTGGFYQGIFKSKDEYQILPDVINDEITFDFVIRPDFISSSLPNTLNYNHVDNKGFFFYIGLRAENKFWYDYNKDPNETFETESNDNVSLLETGQTLATDDGFDITLQGVYNIETDNKHLLFNRTQNGFTTQNFDDTKKYSITGITQDTPNLFLYLNRTATGYTTNTINQVPDISLKANIVDDIISNQIGFRIKDDGSIGYRTIIGSCDTEYDIEEEYSNVGLITNNTWTSITVRMLMSDYSTCGNSNRTFKLLFYINGKLIFISKELPELIFRTLNEREEKQEDVAYNISLGGGTQGLSDMIGFNNDYSTQYLLPLEQYFGGSFIGSISKFRVFDGKYDYSKIKNNYEFEFNPTAINIYIEPTITMELSSNALINPETAYLREKGNTNTLIDGNIQLNRSMNQPAKPLTGYKLYYYPNGSNQTQINGLFSIDPAGGAITEYSDINSTLQTSNLNSLKYMIEVFDTERTINGTIMIKQINFDNMIFYGSTTSVPTTSDDIRNLENRIFNTGTETITLATGTNNNVFIFAIPENRAINTILDSNAMFVDLTNSYSVVQMNVADAGGFETIYNMYIMQNAIPYSRNHNHVITLD